MTRIATAAKLAACLAVITLIAACNGTTSARFSDANTRVVDGYTVKWSDASAVVGRGPNGSSTLMFILAPARAGLPPAGIEQKQRLAKAALDAGGSCKWERFDPALNDRLTFANGGADYTLYVLARC